jgi:hypothetical protein
MSLRGKNAFKSVTPLRSLLTHSGVDGGLGKGSGITTEQCGCREQLAALNQIANSKVVALDSGGSFGPH